MRHLNFASERRVIDGLANMIISPCNTSLINHVHGQLMTGQQDDAPSSIQIAKAAKAIPQGNNKRTNIVAADRLVDNREIGLKAPKGFFESLT